jgi:hypothetical protein
LSILLTVFRLGKKYKATTDNGIMLTQPGNSLFKTPSCPGIEANKGYVLNKKKRTLFWYSIKNFSLKCFDDIKVSSSNARTEGLYTFKNSSISSKARSTVVTP